MPTTARVPILFYSAAVKEDMEAVARAAGADEFLGKMINRAELVDRVRDWLAVVARPGTIGEPLLGDVASDILDVLQAEVVWILGEGPTGLIHLAAACERGEQEAQRFVELAGSGPHALVGSNVLAEVVLSGRGWLNVPLARLGEKAHGRALAEAARALGIRALSLAPLRGTEGRRGLLLFASPRTLAVPRG